MQYSGLWAGCPLEFTWATDRWGRHRCSKLLNQRGKGEAVVIRCGVQSGENCRAPDRGPEANVALAWAKFGLRHSLLIYIWLSKSTWLPTEGNHKKNIQKDTIRNRTTYVSQWIDSKSAIWVEKWWDDIELQLDVVGIFHEFLVKRIG